LLALSDLTAVWQLYFGLFFIAVVMFAPGGITGLLMKHRPLVRAGTLFTVLRAYLVALVPTLTMIAGLILAIEIVVQHTVNAGEDPNTKAFGADSSGYQPDLPARLAQSFGPALQAKHECRQRSASREAEIAAFALCP
jgi:branched-chain amino acid transport system permease protein